ncbi:hypothetical protein [Delftia acidovorans]|uniref:hypothetical protein n=1 Tax=Delftia acidovorans TaxID=80866 RepID=UPI0022ABB137|nr:hypothetical protein [Delftia acidovorans]WAT88530.1 hypothetical protein O1V13_03720 [Delftia acidovorans]
MNRTIKKFTIKAYEYQGVEQLREHVEPPRVLRRLQHLRRWSYDQVKQVLTRGPRACRTHGAGAPSRLPFAVGSH